jgi:site-specific DNA-methyltransferase (adenine-specific)/modification methylase
VAAIRTGRHYIGFEIEQAYCEIAERRIQEELECRNKAQEEKEIREEKQNQ